RVSAHRLFAIGDAAGYVEPFTGEGIAWALTSAVAVVPTALKAMKTWTDALAKEWEAVHQGQIVRRQQLSRAVATILRHPHITRATVALLGRVPALAAPVLRRLNAPLQRGARRS